MSRLAASLARATLLLGLTLPGAAFSAEPLAVTVEGLVLRPGTYSWPAGARLSDASVAAQVRADAWFLGAALLRQSAIQPQQKLKAGVLFDLRSNLVHWQADDKPAGVELANRLLAAVEGMPVTGRVPAQLDPLQQLALSRNALLENRDRIVYPPRASQVRITGAVQADCVLNFDPAWQPVDYLARCPRHELADPSYVDVIQPDGRVQRHGVALWNREAGNVAVGAVLYVPVDSKHLAQNAQGLNEDLVALLATQIVTDVAFGVVGKQPGVGTEFAIAAGTPLLPQGASPYRGVAHLRYANGHAAGSELVVERALDNPGAPITGGATRSPWTLALHRPPEEAAVD